MKIGILTYHRVHNYGAILQAIGLRKYIEDQGHEVYFVDYWPEYHKKQYDAFRTYDLSKTKLKSIVRGIMEDTYRFPLKIRRIRKFDRFLSSFIDPYCAQPGQEFDCIVCGSDQIWRKQAGLATGFDTVYFGKGDYKTKSYISYAGSMGEANLSNEEKETLKDLMATMRQISVREDALIDLLKEIGVDRDIALVADPTILLGADKWRAFMAGQPRKVKEDYVLYYKLADNAFDEDRIRRFAAQKRLRFVLLEGRIRNNDYFNGSITDADPMEMLDLIANASFVFTSSYHGLVFSLLFGRQVVCAFTRNSVRARSLLNYLKIPERLVKHDATVPTEDIDYKTVAPLLDRLGKESGLWLTQALAQS